MQQCQPSRLLPIATHQTWRVVVHVGTWSQVRTRIVGIWQTVIDYCQNRGPFMSAGTMRKCCREQLRTMGGTGVAYAARPWLWRGT